MSNKTVKVQSTSFEINKLITSTQLFSKIKLTLSARLVLRCIVDYWNYKKGYAYPTQVTIAKCTGLTEVAVGKAVKELDHNDLIEKQRLKKRVYYYLTPKLLGCLNLTPKVIYTETKEKFGNNPQCCLGKNILKEKENILIHTTSQVEIEQEANGLAMAKATIKYLSNVPAFKRKIIELKEKYNLH